MSLIPYFDEDFDEYLEEDEYPTEQISPSKTYKIDFGTGKVVGIVDDFDAIVQFIQKVLSTDKYAYTIYDWYYGNELYTLVGKPYAFVKAEIPRIVKDALLVDARINDVTNFETSRVDVDSCITTFTVNTIYGTMDIGVEVNI